MIEDRFFSNAFENKLAEMKESMKGSMNRWMKGRSKRG